MDNSQQTELGPHTPRVRRSGFHAPHLASPMGDALTFFPLRSQGVRVPPLDRLTRVACWQARASAAPLETPNKTCLCRITVVNLAPTKKQHLCRAGLLLSCPLRLGLAVAAVGLIGILRSEEADASSYSIQVNGPAVVAQTTALGEQVTLTFGTHSGQSPSVIFSNSTYTTGCCGASASLRGPDPETTVRRGPSTVAGGGGGGFLDAYPIPAIESCLIWCNYTITFNPGSSSIGSVTVQVFDAAEHVATIAPPSPSGSLYTFSTSIPGQNGKLLFPNQLGQRISVVTKNSTFRSGCSGSDSASIVSTTGAPLISNNSVNGKDCGWDFIEPVTLLDASESPGVTFDPSRALTGQIDLTTYSFLDIAVPIAFANATSVNISVPGQRAFFRFHGYAGQTVSATISSSIAGWYPQYSKARFETVAGSLVGQEVSLAPNATTSLSTILPTAGDYQINIDPNVWDTGNVTVSLNGSPGFKAKVNGLANVGEELSAARIGLQPPADSPTYQWQRCNASGDSCAELGITGATHIATPDDYGKTLRVQVAATNSWGTTTSGSRQSPIILTELETLGLAYRPALLFHQGGSSGENEQWRPVRISSFFNERTFDDFADHAVCVRPETSCPLVWSLEDFSDETDSSNAYIDVGAHLADPLRELLPVFSPCEEPDGLYDCDASSTAAIHFEPGQDEANYRYLDYWWYFRFNQPGGIFGPGDDHAGDWEGVTIVLDPLDPAGSIQSPAPAYGLYATHDMKVWVRADLLPTYAGRHVSVYVARGTHAAYSFPCPIPANPDPNCYQPAGSQWEWEGPHDGLAWWGHNDEGSCAGVCVERFPKTGWPYWLGRWGEDLNEGHAFGNSPESPGRQERFACAAYGQNDGTCQRPPGARPLPLAYGRSSSDSVPNARTCRGWLGFGITAIACDAEKLRWALRTHHFRQRGSLRLFLEGHRSAAGPGLAQVSGEPMGVGERLKVVGTGFQRTIIIVQIRFNGRQRYIATIPFRAISPRKSPRILRLVARNGRPVFIVGDDLVAAKIERG
jgi:hypothetical protein